MTHYNRGEVVSPFAEKVESLPSRSKGSSPEDEIFTWLQYPLDYTHERGYCTELFERLASSLGKQAKLDSDQGVPVSMENPGRRCLSAGSENATDALALGAGRASGAVLPEGVETFNKVKTIMQQAPCLHSNTSQQKASSVEMRYENCEHLHASVQPHGFSNTSCMADGYPAHGAMHNFCTSYPWFSVSPSIPTQGMEKLQLSGDVAAGSTLCETSHFITSNGTGKSSDVHAQIKHAEGSSYSLITEDHSRAASMQAASARHWEPVGSTAPYDAATSFRLSPPRKGREWLERCDNMRADEPDVVPSCSGGSQTSAELSAKETSSHWKQKVDDCQSKNAEVDSTEVSQPHRRLSKRSRVAESHNLSEKRRRNRINEKLKTLQELIPNSSKTDKASILDEAIEYLKALQSQLQMLSSRSSMKSPPMSFPLGMPHMQMAHPMGLGFPLVHTGMGMGLMDLPCGMDGRPFQAFAAAPPNFNLAYPAIAPLPSQTCNQPYLAMEAPSSEMWPLQQLPAQVYNQMYVESQTVASSERGEQLSTPRVSKDS